ncbi:MAG: glycosyltransferase family 39 protein [Chloroflexota bacterium]
MPLPLIWQAGAIFLLTGLLPGILVVDWFTQGLTKRISLLSKGEQALYSIGIGYGVIIVVMLLLSYLPGGIERWQTLLIFDLLLVALAIRYLLSPQGTGHSRELFASPSPRIWTTIGLIILALYGGFFRFADLGYADFQGDEARAVIRAAEAIQGHPDALLGHTKGPAEILIPTALYSIAGQIDEASARLPFAFANFVGLFALFLLGYRLFGAVAGWSGAMLVAVDGYFIGFSHIVQYQSVVFLMVTLAILLLHRAVTELKADQEKRHHGGKLDSLLMLASLLLSTGLLAHYEAGLLLFPGIWLIILMARQLGMLRLIRAMAWPLFAGAGILALFYIPFIRNPNFATTLAYITVNRIGVGGSGGDDASEFGRFPYNNLLDVFERTTLYSSSYYLFLLIGLMALALAWVYYRSLPAPWRWLVIALWSVGLLFTFWQPTWGTIFSRSVDGPDLTVLLFGLAFVACWLMPSPTWQERMVWLWFGGPMLLSIFFIATPNTHVYGFFIGWALLAGMMIERIWHWFRDKVPLYQARLWALATATTLMLLFGNYAYWYFVHNQVEVLRTWQTNRPPGYWTSYTVPTPLSIFGFPFRSGWKAIGTLYADGTLQAAFDTNAVDAVADWYTLGRELCPRDSRYFILSQAVEPAKGEDVEKLRATLEQMYALWGVIRVNNEPRLWIYDKAIDKNDANHQGVHYIDESEKVTFFDRELAKANFERNGSISPSLADQVIEHPLDFYMGTLSDDSDSAIRLRGFTLKNQFAHPGNEIDLTLYWEARQPTSKPLSVTTQILDPNDFRKVGQRDGEPSCNLRPTNHWFPGELFADRYRIPINADAKAGTYQVRIGLYDRETGEALEAFTPEGESAGNGLGISQIDVVVP